MGVPRLFKWLLDNFGSNAPKSYIKNFSKNSKSNTSIDHFYIDSNPLLHFAAQTIFNYGQKKKLLDNLEDLSVDEKIKMVYDLYFQEVLRLIDFVNPKKTIYLAIDGCAPASKMMQQRQRRFISSVSNSEMIFDPNCLSPGTEFMDNLRRYLYYRIINDFQHRNTIKVIFSSANVVGEGEQKICYYIRSLSKDLLENDTHMMYGPDGDLIMLTLASPAQKFYLLRDDMNFPDRITIIDIFNIRLEIAKQMGYQSEEFSKDYFNENNTAGIYNYINDFILMGFFVGNDFLPKIQMFYFLEDGMELLLGIYKQLDEFLIKNNSPIGESFPNGNTIDLKVFSKFVELMQLKESLYLRNQAQMHYNKLKSNNPSERLDPIFENKTLLSACDINKDLNMVFLNYPDYLEKYNKKILKTSKINSIENLSKEYLFGLYWVYKYYTEELLSYDWFYSNYYSPTIFDLSNYLKSNKDNSDFFKSFPINKTPHTPFQQLISILPPKSSKLLPKELGDLLTDDYSPIKEFYPTKFEIDYEGKYQHHQGIALLPMVDYQLVRKVYRETSKKVSEKLEDYSRNKSFKVVEFIRTDKLTSYTNLYDCKELKSLVKIIKN